METKDSEVKNGLSFAQLQALENFILVKLRKKLASFIKIH